MTADLDPAGLLDPATPSLPSGPGPLTLTRLTLNLRHRDVQRDLADAQRLHQRVMSLLPDNYGSDARALTHTLFRLDPTAAGASILVQTAAPVTTHRLPPGYATTDTRDLTPLLDRVAAGAHLRYRILANPTKKAGRSQPRPGVRVALTGAAAAEWWNRRLTATGLAPTSVPVLQPRPSITGTHPAAGRLQHAATLIDGTATVTDPAAAHHAIREGIGHGRAYGLGLLSVALTPTG